MSRLAPFLCLLCLLAACATGPSLSGGGSRTADDDRVATGLAYSHTYEIRFSDESVVGYLIEFFNVPAGIEDERGFPSGTVLVQDLDFETLGFITPGSHAFTHDGELTVDLGFGGRDQHVSRILGHAGRPLYRSIQPGVPTPR